MARSTSRGLRKPDGPIYDKISIVVGGLVRKSSAKQLRERKSAKSKKPDAERQESTR